MVRQEISQKVTFVNSTIVTKQSRSGEYIVSLQGCSGVTLHHDFSHLYAGFTPNTELPGLFSL